MRAVGSWVALLGLAATLGLAGPASARHPALVMQSVPTNPMRPSCRCYAGLRPEELRALRWRHVGAKTLRLEYALEADGSERQLKGDGGERRSVPICAALAADLTAYRAGADDAALIFPFVPVGRTDRAPSEPMTKEDWARWRVGAFRAAREAAR